VDFEWQQQRRRQLRSRQRRQRQQRRSRQRRRNNLLLQKEQSYTFYDDFLKRKVKKKLKSRLCFLHCRRSCFFCCDPLILIKRSWFSDPDREIAIIMFILSYHYPGTLIHRSYSSYYYSGNFHRIFSRYPFMKYTAPFSAEAMVTHAMYGRRKYAALFFTR